MLPMLHRWRPQQRCRCWQHGTLWCRTAAATWERWSCWWTALHLPTPMWQRWLGAQRAAVPSCTNQQQQTTTTSSSSSSSSRTSGSRTGEGAEVASLGDRLRPAVPHKQILEHQLWHHASSATLCLRHARATNSKAHPSNASALCMPQLLTSSSRSSSSSSCAKPYPAARASMQCCCLQWRTCRYNGPPFLAGQSFNRHNMYSFEIIMYCECVTSSRTHRAAGSPETSIICAFPGTACTACATTTPATSST
jgi:hypothetical protein